MNSWSFCLELLFQAQKRSIPSRMSKPNVTRYITAVQTKTKRQTQGQALGSMPGPKMNSQREWPSKNPWNRIWHLTTSGLSLTSRQASENCPIQSFSNILCRHCITGSVRAGAPIRTARSLMISEMRPIEFSAMAIMDFVFSSCSQNLATPMAKPEMDFRAIIFQWTKILWTKISWNIVIV